MVTPKTSKVIKITVTSGVAGQPLTARNRTSGEVIHTVIGDTAKAVIDLENMPSSYTEGDIIDIIVSGERMGSGTVTVSGDSGQSVTVGTSAITSGLSRGI